MWLDLLISLFFAMGCAPLAFFQANCPCCNTCTLCSGGSSGHTQVQATIFGMINNTCGSCPAIDGTYILTQVPATGFCDWELTISTVCNFTRIFVILNSSELIASVSNAGGTIGYAWHDSSAGYNNCDWSSYPVDDSKNSAGGTTACNQGTATLTITAL